MVETARRMAERGASRAEIERAIAAMQAGKSAAEAEHDAAAGQTAPAAPKPSIVQQQKPAAPQRNTAAHSDTVIIPTSRPRYTAAERYATEKGLVLIIPGVGNSWYTDMASGVQAFTCVTQELPAVCRRMFGLTQQREKTHVIGLSMGGYAALKLALTNPYSYTTCTALSAAVRPEQVVKSPDWPLPPAAARAVFGPGIDHGELPPQADLWQLAASADPAALPAIRMVCGEQDALLPANREFHALLQSKGIAHTFETAPGAHTWPFWDAQLKRVLDQIFP